MEPAPAQEILTKETTPPITLAYSPVYIGTYGKADVPTIFLYRLNLANGELIHIDSIKGGENPSYIALDKHRSYLYATNEEEVGGKVSAFSVDKATGKLTFINEQPSLGAPCHVLTEHLNKYVFVANYFGSSVNVFPIQENGGLAPASDFKEHHGSSVNKERQDTAKCHFITPDTNNRFVLVVDLGMDKIMGYRLDAEKGKLIPNDPEAAFTCKPGAGPRHLAFHPNEKFAYLINELDSTMVALAYDGNKGTFTEIQTVSTLPEDFKGHNQCAAVHVRPDGKFVYGSNRGHDSIVVYKIDESTGKLSVVDYVSTQGKWPRDFRIDITGRYLVAANQNTNDVYTFRIDEETGKLAYTGFKAEVPSPTCVTIIKDFC